jgi:hypothetical protein
MRRLYQNLNLILESVGETFTNAERVIDVDKICLDIFQSEFQSQFENREFVIVYNYLDALVDATEHGFEMLFNNPNINYPVKEALDDVEMLKMAIADCIDDNEILSDKAIFKKIRMKVE